MESRPRQTDTQSGPDQSPTGNTDPFSTGQPLGPEQGIQDDNWRARVGEKLGIFASFAVAEVSYRFGLAKNKAGNAAKQAGDYIGVASAWTKEKSADGIAASRLAINGVRRARTDRRLKAIPEKMDGLITSAEVLQASPRRALSEGNALNPDLQIGVSANAHITTHRPVTRREQRQAKRQYNRLRRNMDEAILNRNYRLTYGEQIGTDAHKEALKHERLARSERREANRAAHHYAHNSEEMDKRIARVKRSARSEDKPATAIDRKLKHQERKAGKLAKRYQRLGKKRRDIASSLRSRHPH